MEYDNKWFDNDTQICFWKPEEINGDMTSGNWSEGRIACQEDGGDLAVIETAKLWERLKTGANSWIR